MSPQSGLNSWFQKGRVEMRSARLRALTQPSVLGLILIFILVEMRFARLRALTLFHHLINHCPYVFLRRNEDRPPEGIKLYFSSPLEALHLMQ